jgi:hypothetical protein
VNKHSTKKKDFKMNRKGVRHAGKLKNHNSVVDLVTEEEIQAALGATDIKIRVIKRRV